MTLCHTIRKPPRWLGLLGLWPLQVLFKWQIHRRSPPAHSTDIKCVGKGTWNRKGVILLFCSTSIKTQCLGIRSWGQDISCYLLNVTQQTGGYRKPTQNNFSVSYSVWICTLASVSEVFACHYNIGCRMQPEVGGPNCVKLYLGAAAPYRSGKQKPKASAGQGVPSLMGTILQGEHQSWVL